jgi:hypothetical protein
MQTEQIVALLVAERNRLDAAIRALQGSPAAVSRPAAKRASRRPAATKHVVKHAAVPVPATTGRKRALSAVARKAMADAAKRRWAAIKAGKAPNPFAKAKRAAKG